VGTSLLPLGTSTGWHRCKPTKSFVYWLKAKARKLHSKALEKKPLHTLRKEFGSVVCERHGIYSASLSLGHANIGITARYYLDKKSRATVGLGHLLTAPKNVVEMGDTSAADASSNEPISHPGAAP
jgi:integrase